MNQNTCLVVHYNLPLFIVTGQGKECDRLDSLVVRALLYVGNPHSGACSTDYLYTVEQFQQERLSPAPKISLGLLVSVLSCVMGCPNPFATSGRGGIEPASSTSQVSALTELIIYNEAASSFALLFYFLLKLFGKFVSNSRTDFLGQTQLHFSVKLFV